MICCPWSRLYFSYLTHMGNPYCMPGVVSKFFLSISSFSPLKGPLKLALLLSLVIDEETEAQGIAPGVTQVLIVRLAFRILAPPTPQLCCLGSDSLPGVGEQLPSRKYPTLFPLPLRLRSRTLVPIYLAG